MRTILALLLASPTLALAHHGQDFLLNYDPEVPAMKHATAFGAFEWSKTGDTDEVSVEPGFLAGIAPGLALGSTIRYADDGEGWGYSGVNPMLQYLLPIDSERFFFGVYAGYLFAEGGGHPHGGTVHVHNPNPGGVDQGPDAPPGGGTSHHVHGAGEEHTHNGIHRHGEDHFQLRLLFQANVTDDIRVIANLIGVAPGSGEYDFGYSLGVRRQFTHRWAAGLEAIGDFNTHGEHEVVAGLYWTPVHACTVRLGVGTGIGSEGKDFSLHSGLTWRF